MVDIIIFPFSGTGIEVLDCLGDQFKCIGFVSDDFTNIGKEYNGIKIYSRSFIYEMKDAKIIAVPGSPNTYKKRNEIITGLNLEKERFATIVHPKSNIGHNVKLGYNCIIMAGVVITSNASLGNHVIVLANSVIHHDSQIGDFTILSSNVTVAGNVIVGQNCYLGACCTLINGCTIGRNTLIGMGSNVIKSIGEDKKVVGNPSREI